MTIELTPEQQQASEEILDFLTSKRKYHVLEGPAGTGKTTLLKYILKAISDIRKTAKIVYESTESLFSFDDIYVTATTNKAAIVASELSGTDPITIHSLLGVLVRNDYKTGKQILDHSKGKLVTSSLIIIDEASFIDDDLLEIIAEATVDSKILFVGDPYQLLPPTNTKSSIFSRSLPTSKLTTILRNQGAIEHLAMQLRNTVKGELFPLLAAAEQKIVVADGPTFQRAVNRAFSDLEHVDAARMLCWTNDRTMEYTKYIRGLRKEPEHFTAGEIVITNQPIMSHKKTLYSTDAVVRINDVEPAYQSGTPGFMVDVGIDPDPAEIFIPHDPSIKAKKLKALAKEKNWVEYFSIKENWGDLRSPYSCTVHKSQGSTYDEVFIDLSDIGRCNNRDTVARMLYVAISRARKRVYLYGELPKQYSPMELSQAL